MTSPPPLFFVTPSNPPKTQTRNTKNPSLVNGSTRSARAHPISFRNSVRSLPHLAHNLLWHQVSSEIHAHLWDSIVPLHPLGNIDKHLNLR